jgi:hypothetical protein
MSESFNEEDLFYQHGKRSQEQSFDKTMQRLHRWAELEGLAQQRLWFLVAITIPKTLYKYSPLSIFTFVIPLLLYVAASISITSGLNSFNSSSVAAIGYLVFGVVCLCLMFGSIFYFGYRKAVALNRIIAMSQIILVAVYTLLSIWQAIEESGRIRYFSPGNIANILNFLMLLLCLAMVISDVISHSFTDRRSME